MCVGERALPLGSSCSMSYFCSSLNCACPLAPGANCATEGKGLGDNNLRKCIKFSLKFAGKGLLLKMVAIATPTVMTARVEYVLVLAKLAPVSSQCLLAWVVTVAMISSVHPSCAIAQQTNV